MGACALQGPGVDLRGTCPGTVGTGAVLMPARRPEALAWVWLQQHTHCRLPAVNGTHGRAQELHPRSLTWRRCGPVVPPHRRAILNMYLPSAITKVRSRHTCLDVVLMHHH